MKSFKQVIYLFYIHWCNLRLVIKYSNVFTIITSLVEEVHTFENNSNTFSLKPFSEVFNTNYCNKSITN